MVDTRITFLNGQTIEADFYDLDFREKYREHTGKFAEKVNDIDLTEDDLVVLSKQMELLKTCIDSVFGQEEGERLFAGKRNVMLMFDILNKLKSLNEAVNADLGSLKPQIDK